MMGVASCVGRKQFRNGDRKKGTVSQGVYVQHELLAATVVTWAVDIL